MIRKLLVVLGHIGVIVAFVIAISIFGMMAPKPQKQEGEAPAPVVFVQDVEYNPISLDVFAQGEVQPKQQIMLTSQVGGKITMVSDEFASGGVIRKGQLLVQIEDADYRLAVTRSRARVATALQALEIERAESSLAQQDYEELAAVTGQGAPSDLTLRRPQLARAEAEYQSALADLQEAELSLSRAQVRAPFDGRVRSISANLGQVISPSQTLGEIFSTDVAEIRLPLTDEDLARLNLPLAFNDEEQGPLVALTTIAAGKERNWEGRITRVDAAIDATTRQIAAIVEVKDPYGAAADNGFPLAIGLFVDASIKGPEIDSATIVPRIAVQQENMVYTVDGENRIVETPVQVAATTTEGYVITSGLRAGQRVVISRLTTAVGSIVQPLDPNAPSTLVSNEESDEEPSESASASGGSANAGGQ